MCKHNQIVWIWICVQMNTLYTHSCCLDSNFINHDFHYWITIREVNMRKGDRSFCVLHKNFMDVSVTVDDDAYINRHSAENSHWNAHPQFGCFHSIPLFHSLVLSLSCSLTLCRSVCASLTRSLPHNRIASTSFASDFTFGHFETVIQMNPFWNSQL